MQIRPNAVVSGKVAPALPPQPFNVLRSVPSNAVVSVLGPTTATLALTDLTFTNSYGNGAARVAFSQISAAAPNNGCSNPRTRYVTVYHAPSAQTVVQNFATRLC